MTKEKGRVSKLSWINGWNKSSLLRRPVGNAHHEKIHHAGQIIIGEREERKGEIGACMRGAHRVVTCLSSVLLALGPRGCGKWSAAWLRKLLGQPLRTPKEASLWAGVRRPVKISTGNLVIYNVNYVDLLAIWLKSNFSPIMKKAVLQLQTTYQLVSHSVMSVGAACIYTAASTFWKE